MRTSQIKTGFLLLALVIYFVYRLLLSANVGLSDDEAYYWTWSQHLSLSYYDHPGMVAWLIRISCEIFGNSNLGVRFFALGFYLSTTLILWKLAQSIFNSRVAWLTVFFFLAAPLFSVGGLLMVPDAPFTFFQLCFVLLAWKIAFEDDDRWSTWLLLGFSIGLGLLSKYTISITIVALLGFLASGNRLRQHFKSVKFYSSVLIAAALALPIFAWNAENGWLSFKYHLHDRQLSQSLIDLNRWAQFWCAQAIEIGVPLLLLGLAVWIVCLRRWSDLRWRFLLLTSLPCFALFCAQSLFAPFRPHWPAPCYFTLFIAIAGWLEEPIMQARPQTFSKFRTIALSLIFALTVPVSALILVDVFSPVIATAASSFRIQWNPRYDPTNDLYGWRRAAAEIQRLKAAFPQNDEPFVSAAQYALVSQLQFRLSERVWRAAPARDASDFWPATASKESLRGRNSIFVTDNRFQRDPRKEGHFEKCELSSELPIFRHAVLARTFYFWRCLGFRDETTSLNNIATLR